MKSSILFFFMFALFTTVNAQPPELLVKKGNKGFYVEHKAAPKDNFYSVGRLYNVHPKFIASYNSLDMSKGLALGQLLKIPLTDTNFVQEQKGLPVYHIAPDKETLVKLSDEYKKVKVEDLRLWNQLTADNISKGQKVIVGYLVSKEQQTIVAKTETPVQEVKKPVTEEQVKTTPKEEMKNEEKAEEKKPEIKIEPKTENKTEPKQVKQETRPEDNRQGFFKSQFSQQVKQQPLSKEQTVTSGIFKTSSGWTDEKYFLLVDGIEPGTVLKLTNPTNKKAIYAKVLGDMSSYKQIPGTNIRISDAAASALSVEETEKFIVRLNY
jgi:hypothetical protein